MFCTRTLQPNVQLIVPPKGMDRENLFGWNLGFQTRKLPTILLVDLRELRVMDCAGLAWLVNLQIEMVLQGKTLLLLGPSSRVTDTFRRANIGNRFLKAENLGQAYEVLSDLHPELIGTNILCGH